MATEFIIQEAKALLVRMRQVQSFTLNMPMVGAAAISDRAQRAINEMLIDGRKRMIQRINEFIQLVKVSHSLPAHRKQSAYALLKLQFNALLDRLDIFADVLTQRSEHGTGIWLAGLDVLARDALIPQKGLFIPPPLVCYLDRGHGAAIRRARTRLPGGPINPVAVIRVPRERMISTGIASSLVHEVGHQGAALMDLIPSLREALQQAATRTPQYQHLWKWYERWISEIVADFWGVATLGVGATTGLMNVVSLPKYFVFRLNMDDPHPPPWIRVKLSIAFGASLYSDPQWGRLDQLWDQLYPLKGARQEDQATFKRLEGIIPDFVKVLLGHRSKKLKGQMLKEVFPVQSRQPAQLRQLYQQWQQNIHKMKKIKPALIFAVLGQARTDNLLSPIQENDLLSKMLQVWALRSNY